MKDKQIGGGIARSDHSRSKEGMTRPSGQDRQSAVESVGKSCRGDGGISYHRPRWKQPIDNSQM
jgi:hypothetical protein